QAYPMMTLVKFHWIESLIGGLLFLGLGTGLVSWWLIPIAASLAFAVPLSGLSAFPLARIGVSSLRLDNPLTLREPAIVTNAPTARAEMRARIEATKIAAE
ncbi:MAG: glucans biosynthesis glucosyltransferase MdoH, partial [Ruegeria sp.]